jgi:hypothetical protein
MCDIYDGFARLSKFKVIEMSLNGKGVRDPDKCYEKKGVITLENSNRIELGDIVIPFAKIGDLKKGAPVKVEIDYKMLGAFKKMFSEEYAVAPINHLTEQVVTKLIAPDQCEIELTEKDYRPFGFDITDSDSVSRIIDAEAMIKTNRPKNANAFTLVWTLDKPLITDDYRLWFKVKRKPFEEPGVKDSYVREILLDPITVRRIERVARTHSRKKTKRINRV